MVALRNTFFTYPTAHGAITISSSGRGVTSVAFGDEPGTGSRQATEITNRAATQIQEYLAGKRTSFDVPLDVAGSPFQRAVWAQVSEIPYGATRTAAEVADLLGRPGAHRSVGTAVRRNPLPILVPTHRVGMPNATGKTARVFRALRAMEQSAAQSPGD